MTSIPIPPVNYLDGADGLPAPTSVHDQVPRPRATARRKGT
jgi:hypothetical protein